MSEYFGCLICDVGNAWLGPLLFMIVMLICAGTGYALRGKIKAFCSEHRARLTEYSHRATITFVTMQVTTNKQLCCHVVVVCCHVL